MNWAGFYFVRGDELVLGRFAGKPAVARIAFGTGVCGRAWAERHTLVVDSPRPARFGAAERSALEALAACFVAASDAL